jgi:nicotinamidase-related amidase
MKLLMVIDVQHDFVDGALGSPEAQAIIPNVKAKVEEYFSYSDPIIYTRDTHQTNYLSTAEGKALPVPHCIYGTEGWEIMKEVYVPTYSYIVDKPTFGYLELVESIKRVERNRYDDIEEIELVGLCTDICVISNALILKAAFPNIPISVDSSCCAGVTPEKHAAALEVMKSCQINVY